MTKEERATELMLHVLRLIAGLFNWEGETKLTRAGVAWNLSRNKYPHDCSVGSNYILIALCPSFLICIKGIKISAPLVAVTIKDGVGPGSQDSQRQLWSSMPVRLWMTSKEQGWVEHHGLQPHGSFL